MESYIKRAMYVFEGSYINRCNELIFIAVLGVLSIGIYNFTTGNISKMRNEVKRDVYKSNPQYLEGVIDDLAKYMYEYNTAKTEDEKLAIQQIVVHRFSDFDFNKILDGDLREFVRKCFDVKNKINYESSKNGY